MSTGRIGILIIGGGPAGLGAAWRLAACGRDDWLLVEREAEPGGLSRSFRDRRGFTWDLGGHVIHSGYDLFNGVVREALGGECLEHERRAFIRIAGRFVPYPFQNNLHRLPEEVREECLAGIVAAARAGSAGAPADFGAWVEVTFGPGIARHFMRPYNRKLWCCDLSELSAGWVAERVARPSPERLVANVRAGRDDASWGPNRTFLFPARGGTGALWQKVAGALPAGRLRLGSEVVEIAPRTRTCRLAGGERVGYERLISTAPLTELVRLAGLDGLAGAAARLRHNSAEIFGLGLAGEPPGPVRDKTWMYFPEPECPFYRATVFSNYSPRNVPHPGAEWSLLLEVARSPEEPSRPAGLWPRVIAAARAEELVPPGAEPVSCWHRTLPFAYPLPALGRDAALAEIVPELERMEVYPRGRFGAWRYEVGNMDHSFMQGVELVDRLLEGRPESVLPAPGRAGARG